MSIFLIFNSSHTHTPINYWVIWKIYKFYIKIKFKLSIYIRVVLYLQHCHNTFTTNYRRFVIIGFNLNILIKLLFVSTNNNPPLRICCELKFVVKVLRKCYRHNITPLYNIYNIFLALVTCCEIIFILLNLLPFYTFEFYL